MLENRIKSLRNELKRNPNHWPTLAELAGLLRSAGKVDQAISLLEKYAGAHSEDFDAQIA